MEPVAIGLFFITSVVIIITPGPDMIYVLTQGISKGKKAGILSAIGVVSGLLIHTIIASFGLGIIITTSRIAYSILKHAGAAYLCYLGFKAIREKSKIEINESKKDFNTSKTFINGLLSNVFNPKIIVFFMAFLPQFIDPNKVNSQKAFLTLGLVFAIMGAIFLSIIGYMSGRIGALLKKNKTIMKWMNKVAGSIMIGLGIRLAIEERK